MRRAIYTLSLAAVTALVTSAQEPKAGKWKTWIISSGAEFRVPAPPDEAETKAELRHLHELTASVDEARRKQIQHWDAGAPVYRWMDMLERRTEAGEPLTAHPHRVYAYVAVAMYDATIAAWESKYAYKRPRPSELDPPMRVLVDVPHSPSYPSEHSAAAAAAAAVLGRFFPGQAAAYKQMADEAGFSRIFAGVQFPSDHEAGMILGEQVAQKVPA
jgi:hypothetical protein